MLRLTLILNGDNKNKMCPFNHKKVKMMMKTLGLVQMSSTNFRVVAKILYSGIKQPDWMLQVR